MRVEIMQLHQELGATMIYVTHDQVEAMTMADRIVVLNHGVIEQVGSPLDLYNKPGLALRRGLHRLAEDELHVTALRLPGRRRTPSASAPSISTSSTRAATGTAPSC